MIHSCNRLDRKKVVHRRYQNDWGNENAAARLRSRRESHSPVTELGLADVCVCERERERREREGGGGGGGWG